MLCDAENSGREIEYCFFIGEGLLRCTPIRRCFPTCTKIYPSVETC